MDDKTVTTAQSQSTSTPKESAEGLELSSLEALHTYDVEKLEESEAVTPTLDSNFLVTRDLWIFAIPEHLQYNPSKPFGFNYAKTAIYSVTTTLSELVSTFNEYIYVYLRLVVANLYYSQPLLSMFFNLTSVGGGFNWSPVQMSKSFEVSYEEVSRYDLS